MQGYWSDSKKYLDVRGYMKRRKYRKYATLLCVLNCVLLIVRPKSMCIEKFHGHKVNEVSNLYMLMI